MNRRHFLLSTALAAARPPVRITHLRFAPIQGRFHKFVSMNSYDKAPKGHTYENTLARIATDQGVEGAGVTSGVPNPAFLAAVKALIGADPLALYRMEGGRIVGRALEHEKLLRQYRHLDGPLFDLIGKLTNRPAWKLIGDAARGRIEVYDGTLYFADVWFRDRGVRAVVEEAEEAARRGYLGMKFKVGRGWKWLEKDAGLRRDIDVLKAVRKAVGPKVKVLADANNGYQNDFDRAWRFMAETREANLHWMEELFPEDPAQYGLLKDRMNEAGIKTLVADGENVRDLDAFQPYLRPRRLMDVLQMDMRQGGFLDCIEMARMAEAAGGVAVPHNWASQVGLLMGLHLAKAVRAVAAAEDDRSTCDVFVDRGYEFRDGYYTLPDAPGLGIGIDETVYREKYQAKEVVVS